MKPWIPLVAALFMASPLLQAGDTAPWVCALHMLGALPAPLAVNAGASPTDREYPVHGRVAQGPDALQGLPRGRYLFLVNAEGQLIYSAAIPDYTVDVKDDSVPIVVSHRSLDAFAAREGLSRDYMFAGEFIITNRLEEVNNRSSTFPGGSERLALSAQVLPHFGLVISPEIALADYSQPELASKNLHLTAADIAGVEISERNNPLIPEVDALIQEVARRRFNRAHPRGVDLGGTFDLHVLMNEWYKEKSHKEERKALNYVVHRFRMLDEATSSHIAMEMAQAPHLLGLIRRTLFMLFDKDEVIARLAAMVKADQDARSAQPFDGEHMRRIDEANTAAMKEIVATYGWITISNFGAQAAQYAWLLVQHADLDPAFQEHCLGLMGDALQRNDVSSVDYAYLWDRVKTGKGEPQHYGTQGRCTGPGQWEPLTLEDPARLEELRSQMGMTTMAEYLRQVSSFCR